MMIFKMFKKMKYNNYYKNYILILMICKILHNYLVVNNKKFNQLEYYIKKKG